MDISTLCISYRHAYPMDPSLSHQRPHSLTPTVHNAQVCTWVGYVQSTHIYISVPGSPSAPQTKEKHSRLSRLCGMRYHSLWPIEHGGKGLSPASICVCEGKAVRWRGVGDACVGVQGR